jgi:hypothetical protein
MLSCRSHQAPLRIICLEAPQKAQVWYIRIWRLAFQYAHVKYLQREHKLTYASSMRRPRALSVLVPPMDAYDLQHDTRPSFYRCASQVVLTSFMIFHDVADSASDHPAQEDTAHQSTLPDFECEVIDKKERMFLMPCLPHDRGPAFWKQHLGLDLTVDPTPKLGKKSQEERPNCAQYVKKLMPVKEDKRSELELRQREALAPGRSRIRVSFDEWDTLLDGSSDVKVTVCKRCCKAYVHGKSSKHGRPSGLDPTMVIQHENSEGCLSSPGQQCHSSKSMR